MRIFNGLSASEGIAIGVLFCSPKHDALPIPTYYIEENDIPLHKERFHKALSLAQKKIKEILDTYDAIDQKDMSESVKTEKEIFNTHSMMLSDIEFSKEVIDELEHSKQNIESVLKKCLAKTITSLHNSGNEYLMARAVDIHDAFTPVFLYLHDDKQSDSLGKLYYPKGAIVVTHSLAPSQALSTREADVKAIVMEEGGAMSHIAILARAWDIPLVMGVRGCSSEMLSGLLGIVDGDKGLLIVEPDDVTLKKYEVLRDKRKEEALIASQHCGVSEPLYTKDGIHIKVAANIAFSEDVKKPLVVMSDGIGLYRSEFLFLDKSVIPTEQAQYNAYSEVVSKMGDKPVVIRTFDAGADKMLEEQKDLKELNPLLGWRAIRYCLDRTDVFKVQLRALLRAGVHGNLHIMVPMISTIEEINKVKALIAEIEAEFTEEGVPYKKNIPLGIMVEVPAVAISAEMFAPSVDFFSIGTNDLVQYTMAADRENASVVHLTNYFHPSVLKLIKNTINAEALLGNGSNSFVSMCGEMASDLEALVLLLGMGLRHFSMAPQAVLRVKKLIPKISISDAQALYESIKKINTASEIKEIVSQEIKKYE